MHPAINTTSAAAYKQMKEKHQFFIRYLATKNKTMARKLLKKMEVSIKRDKNGKVAKKSMDDLKKMELFRDELNSARLKNVR